MQNLQDFPAVIGGSVVDDNHLERRVVLGAYRFDTAPEEGGMVIRRNDDGDEGILIHISHWSLAARHSIVIHWSFSGNSIVMHWSFMVIRWSFFFTAKAQRRDKFQRFLIFHYISQSLSHSVTQSLPRTLVLSPSRPLALSFKSSPQLQDNTGYSL
jgi:hypothetical protein